MAVTYSYDPPVGGATEIQVVFEYNNHYQSRSIESVFTDGEYDATARNNRRCSCSNYIRRI